MTDRRILLANLVIFSACVITGTLGLFANAVQGLATLIWAPSGFAMAGMLLFGPRIWPAIALSSLLTYIISGRPVAAADLGLGSNLFEAVCVSLTLVLKNLVALKVLQRLGISNVLGSYRSMLALFIVTITTSTLAPTVGVLALKTTSGLTATAAGYMWTIWWLGQIQGTIILTPLILAWTYYAPTRLIFAKKVEAVALSFVFIAACIWVFFMSHESTGATWFTGWYVLYAVLIWSAARFGRFGAATFNFIIAAFAIASALMTAGPFAAEKITGELLHIHTHVTALSIPSLLLAVLIENLTAAQTIIQQKQEDLEAKVKNRTRDLHQAVEELQNNRYFLAEAQRLAKIGTWRLNAQDNQIKWSPEYLSITGQPLETAPPTFDAYLRSLTPENSAQIQSAVQRAIKYGADFADFAIETTIATPSGKTKVLRSQGRAKLDQSGNVTEVIGVSQDVTEAKSTEVELRAAKQTADNASRSKTHFLANMSHEIRTPLGIILGFAELLSDPKLSAHERMNYVRTIEKNGRLLSDLVNDILDLSKIESGKRQIESIDVSLPDLMRDMKQLLEPKANENGLALRFSFRGSLPTLIRTDPTALRQILMNIIGNAIKFTQRGKIEVRTLLIKHARKGGAAIAFDIADTGVGMTEEQRAKLFKPFTQADASTTRKFGGTGLGLVLSQSLARALGGDLMILASRPGKGTVFRVTINPGRLEQRSFRKNFDVSGLLAPTALAKTPVALAGKSILLVEDSPDNQRLVTKFLSSVGANVEIAGNGADGIDRALKGQHDLILMDIQMPVMDGHEATRRLRESGYTRPIIAVTAHALVEERERCLHSGFSDYLSKPLSRGELIEHIAHLSRPH